MAALIVGLGKHQYYITETNQGKFVGGTVILTPITVEITGRNPFPPEIGIPALGIPHEGHGFHWGAALSGVGKNELLVHGIGTGVSPEVVGVRSDYIEA